MASLLSSLLTAVSALALGSTGSWDLRAGDQTFFRIEIRETPDGATATWERPEHFQTDGENFSRVSGPVIRRQTRSVRSVGADIEIVFDDPTPGSAPDILRLHPVDTDHMEMTIAGAPFEPFPLIRTRADAASLGPWDSGRSYAITFVRPSNAEMSAIFDADQADRESADIDWSIVGPADDERRGRARRLLDSGALQSGDDYYHAAFVFQHGSDANDYLMAHLLATIAIARGRSDAVWIASATLDRYLQAIGKPQILGTQYTISAGAPATQEPYDRALISDAMRKALHVPSIKEQEERRRQYGEAAPAPQKN
ncbi:hypothetical protein [Sphingopyxis sp.]|uniref:hypothetical protein n=1 Tax=Sphingopyxis sp. TaxID=1908224 RepID=UPI002637CA21|nr:hypothetical protein [Sphingopyxis sp.]MCW0197467.1 hypothetical protein [Sphingopyxis sp.]